MIGAGAPRRARALPARRATWLSVALLPLVGCGPAAPLAQLDAKAPAAVEAKGAIERYTLGPADLSVEADVSAGSAYTLRLTDVTGELTLDPETPEASAVSVHIRTAAVETTIGLVGDVAKSEFLHVAEYPDAAFVSRAFRPRGSPGQYTLYGDLTLHGTTHSLAVPATLTVERCRALAEVAFTVDRRQFGVVSAGGVDSVVSDIVEVRIRAEAKRKGC